jgi:hypothetical protein
MIMLRTCSKSTLTFSLQAQIVYTLLMILYTIITLEQAQEVLDVIDNTKFMMIKNPRLKHR